MVPRALSVKSALNVFYTLSQHLSCCCEKITLQMQLKEGWLSVAQFLDPVHPSEESKAAGAGGSSE